jgi:GR25 family glycosyltransferase involved in LPS biosynthesis
MALPYPSLLLLSILFLLRPFLSCARPPPLMRESSREEIKVTCGRNASQRSGPVPDVFWINLDKSVERRIYFERQLGSHGMLKGSSRIRALSPDNVIVPEEIAVPHECKILTSKSVVDIPELLKRPRGRILIDALCGRPRNSKRELTVTASHLQALHTAVNSISESPYALILEDDMALSFDVDYHALAQSAPPDFAILQLVTSNDQNLKYLWKKYVDSGGKYLWEQRSDITDFWCAGAYIINKEVFKPIIDRIVRKITSNGWTAMSIIAAYPCKPDFCCAEVDPDFPWNEASANKRQVFYHGWHYDNRSIPFGRLRTNPACMFAPKGYQADHFVFEIARPHAYTLSVPLIGGAGKAGTNSTLHQEHVQWHKIAFDSIVDMQKEIYDGKVALPPFVRRC